MPSYGWKLPMLYLAKVGVEGSNPFARSNFFKHLASTIKRKVNPPSAVFPQNCSNFVLASALAMDYILPQSWG